MTLDDRLQKLALSSYPSHKAKQAILSDLLEIIGEDIPLHQPFDDKYDYVEMGGWTIFRKGANWYKQELREKVKKYCD